MKIDLSGFFYLINIEKKTYIYFASTTGCSLKKELFSTAFKRTTTSHLCSSPSQGKQVCRQIPAHTDVYVTREVSLFSDDTVQSLEKRITVFRQCCG